MRIGRKHHLALQPKPHIEHTDGLWSDRRIGRTARLRVAAKAAVEVADTAHYCEFAFFSAQHWNAQANGGVNEPPAKAGPSHLCTAARRDITGAAIASDPTGQ